MAQNSRSEQSARALDLPVLPKNLSGRIHSHITGSAPEFEVLPGPDSSHVTLMPCSSELKRLRRWLTRARVTVLPWDSSAGRDER